MASVEREPIMGIWGCAPSGVQGQSPWSGGQGAKLPEAERFLVLSDIWNGAKLLCLWAVLWSLMVAAVPTCVHSFAMPCIQTNIVIEVYSNFCLLLKSTIESKNISKLVKQRTLENNLWLGGMALCPPPCIRPACVGQGALVSETLWTTRIFFDQVLHTWCHL